MVMKRSQLNNLNKTATQIMAQRERRKREAVMQAKINGPELMSESNDNRNRLFYMTPELIQMEILRELRRLIKIIEEKE